ncbi:MAG: translational GTPase TypA [Planctomycetota bacterium]
MQPESIRNVAIIAHVDHGKTTLVDKLLYQSGMFRDAELDRLAGGQHNLILDSDPLERERGITILSKNCSIRYAMPDGNEVKINVIDTPGHADFGGEVERVLAMADGCLLLVDSFEGPMPQTRFVVQKALEHGMRPIVVVNKVDRPDARPDDVVNEVFDLLVAIGADDEALDFPILYASARDGWAVTDLEDERRDLRVLLDAIVDHVPPPRVKPDEPLAMLVTTLDHSEFVGRIAIGRVSAGTVRTGQEVAVIRPGEVAERRKVQEVFRFEGLDRAKVESVGAGDICALVGLDPIHLGQTVCDPVTARPIDSTPVDQPTLHMTFRVNDGPFAGREGKYVTSRQVKDRLDRELLANVALRVEPGARPEEFRVSGRGLMHLGILIENMRREGYELTVGKPQVIEREIDGKRCEPMEQLVVDCPADVQNAVMSLTGSRRAELVSVEPKAGASGFVHMEFVISARGLIGLRSRMMTATQGQAIVHHSFHGYRPVGGELPGRAAGVMMATEGGRATPYALDMLDDRGFFFVKPGDQVYEGQVVGGHCRDNDIVVNVVRAKKLTNYRAAGKDDAAKVRPFRQMSLEDCLEYIETDELVEVTPNAVRMRKRTLSASERKRQSRNR